MALAQRLETLRHENPVVLALPRGGVPVAYEVARALRRTTRRHGRPQARCAVPAGAGDGRDRRGGVRVLDPDTVRVAQVTADEIAAVEARERAELERRVHLYRGDRPMTSLDGRTVIIVDDGIATGGTARAAVEIARVHGARRVVLAVPVAAPESVRELSERCRRRSSRSRRRARSSRSAPGTSDSPRRPTKRCGRCSARPAIPGSENDDPRR